MNKQLEELAQPVAWPNGCNHSAIAALRYLAEKPRPAYGNSPYNTEHLYMIAGELKRMASQPLYSQEYVAALLQRIAELEAKLALVREQRDNELRTNAELEKRLAAREAVPAEITSADAPEIFEIAAEVERLGLRGTYGVYIAGWNACRAARLGNCATNEARSVAGLAAETGENCAAVIPAGYKLAPNEPTPDMIDAGKQRALDDIMENNMFFVSQIYRAMLAAAPATPSAPDDLIMQVRRLVHALKKANPDHALVKQVPDYMRRAGYWKLTDCLRGAAAAPEVGQ